MFLLLWVAPNVCIRVCLSVCACVYVLPQHGWMSTVWIATYLFCFRLEVPVTKCNSFTFRWSTLRLCGLKRSPSAHTVHLGARFLPWNGSMSLFFCEVGLGTSDPSWGSHAFPDLSMMFISFVVNNSMFQLDLSWGFFLSSSLIPLFHPPILSIFSVPGSSIH